MKTILVVDDSVTIQRVLKFTLQRQGYGVLVASSAAEALGHLATNDVSLAIVDISMPEVDGIMLLAQIRAEGAHAALPVIMLTASGMDDDRVLAQDAGANAFLTKPVSSIELIDTVSQFVSTEDTPA